MCGRDQQEPCRKGWYLATNEMRCLGFLPRGTSWTARAGAEEKSCSCWAEFEILGTSRTLPAVGNRGSSLTSPFHPDPRPHLPNTRSIPAPRIRTAPDLIQAQRGNCLLPFFLSDLPSCLPGPPSFQVWRGAKRGRLIFHSGLLPLL